MQTLLGVFSEINLMENHTVTCDAVIARANLWKSLHNSVPSS